MISEPTLATRLTLLCHAATPAMRDARFPYGDEALDDGGRRKRAALRLPRFDRAFTSPAPAARQTLGGATIAAELRDIDYGEWAGLTLGEAHARDPEALAGWIGLERGTPGGETPAEVAMRVGLWMAALADSGESIVAVSHAIVLRGAIAYALAIPIRATARIDIAPLTRVGLSYHGAWRLGAVTPAGG